MARQTVEIHLAYYKQGDDLGHFLEQTKNPKEAMKVHAEMMRSVAEHLEKIVEIVGDNDVEINADTHHIDLTCEEDLAKKLIDAELAEKEFEFEEDGEIEFIEDEEIK